VPATSALLLSMNLEFSTVSPGIRNACKTVSSNTKLPAMLSLAVIVVAIAVWWYLAYVAVPFTDGPYCDRTSDTAVRTSDPGTFFSLCSGAADVVRYMTSCVSCDCTKASTLTNDAITAFQKNPSFLRLSEISLADVFAALAQQNTSAPLSGSMMLLALFVAALCHFAS